MIQQLYFWVYTQKNLKAGTQTDTCIPTLSTALFAIAKQCGNNPCSLVDEWVNNIHRL